MFAKVVLFSDVSNPIKFATYRKCELKSPDLLAISILVKDKYVNEITYSRK